MRSRRATGFWVGCLAGIARTLAPIWRLAFPGVDFPETDFICLPRLVSFMSL